MNDFRDYLMHFGIKGMHWGVRRYQNPDGSLTEAGKKRYINSISSDKVNLLQRKNGNYEVYDKNLKKVGDVLIDDEGDNLHIDWLGIKEKERRKGYGQDALKAVISDCIKQGKKTVTLEAANLDPAALHIYEKLGFEYVNKINSEYWNDLVEMVKPL